MTYEEYDKMDLIASEIAKLEPIMIQGFLYPYLEWKAENEPEQFEALFNKFNKIKS